MQMGEIPLLSRSEEIDGRQADRAQPQALPLQRAGHRLHAASRDRPAGEGLRRQLRLDRTVEVSVTNVREKRHIMGCSSRIWHTLRQLLRRNQATSASPSARAAVASQRRQAWRRLIARRARAVRLIEEVGLRTQRLQALAGARCARSPSGWTASAEQLRELRRSGRCPPASPSSATSCTT